MKSLKRVLFFFVFFITLTSFSNVAFANYDEYTSLFKNQAFPPQLKVLQKMRPSAAQGVGPVFDFKFHFQAQFNITTDILFWYWDHIHTNNPSKAFIVRICEVAESTGVPINPDTCIYGTVPSARDVRPTDIRVTGEPICKVGSGSSNTTCTLPVGAEAYPKIYERTATVSGNGTLQPGQLRTAFNTIFGISYQGFKNAQGQTQNLSQTFASETAWFKADIWYCGSPTTNVRFTAALTNSYSKEDVNTFGNFCGENRPYFKIATSENFQVTEQDGAVATPIDPTGGSSDPNNPADGSTTTSKYTNSVGVPNCGLGIWSGSVMGCVAQIVYYLIYRPVAWFAGIMGNLFDFFLGYSLSDESYRAAFAVRGWQIVRDISNIFLIIILVYTGLLAVFTTSTNIKKVVSGIIINAVLINFSLFGTRVIIDLSNVIARVFYKTVEVCDGPCDKDVSGTSKNKKPGIAGYTPLSEKIVAAFNPQKIFSADMLSSASSLPNNGTSSSRGNKTLTVDDNEYAGYYTVVSLIAAVILFAIAMMFWKTGFFFLGRVIGLYIAMIFAPFAVLTKGGMPIVGNIKQLAWDKWFDDLFKYAALAPIFVFFLYVVYSFLETDFIKVYIGKSGSSFFETVVYIAIPMLIVYMMLSKGVSLAEQYAGDFGKMVTKFANTATGVVGGAALGVASGGVALAGRNVLGRLGTRVAESDTLRDASARGGIRGWLADRTIRVGGNMSRATYDTRNTALPRTLQQNLGVGITNSGVGRLLGTNTNRTAGGFRESITRNERDLADRANRLQVTGQQARNMDAANSAWESGYQGRRNAAQAAALAAGQVFNESLFRFSDMRAQAAAGNARPRSAAETNRRRERTYQATLARGTVLSRAAESVTNRFTAPTSAVGATTTAVSGVTTLAGLAGGTTVAAAAIIGQGAIQGAARQNVIASRRNQARPTVSGGQRNRMLNQLAQLQRDQLRVYTSLSAVVNFLGLPVTPNNVNSLSVIDVQNYQSANPGHGMASPNTVISERNRINNDINNVRTQLGI